MVNIITNREREIIDKKINGHSLTQNESNILSKSIRPKLEEIKSINPESILDRIEYNQKAKPIENRIRSIILRIIKETESIIICGSAIQTNYREYNDIDVIIATKGKIEDKIEIVSKIKEESKKEGLKLDIQIYPRNLIIKEYPRNPSLIYQLKDSKIIYGKIDIENKIHLSKNDLKMKLDWSEGLDKDSTAEDIYSAIRNAYLVSLLLDRKIDNYELKNRIISALGKDLIDKIKQNQTSKQERSLLLSYLNLLVISLEDKINEAKWEKIVIENP